MTFWGRFDRSLRFPPRFLLVVIPILGEAQTGFVPNSIIRPYEVKPVPQVNFQNSQRIFDLMRAGQLYLSLADAIAIALENNLDIDLERYLPRIAQTDVGRANGGGLLRGLSLLVNEPLRESADRTARCLRLSPPARHRRRC